MQAGIATYEPPPQNCKKLQLSVKKSQSRTNLFDHLKGNSSLYLQFNWNATQMFYTLMLNNFCVVINLKSNFKFCSIPLLQLMKRKIGFILSEIDK